MAHHAYLVTGDIEEGIENALDAVRRVLCITTDGNPDVNILRYGLFSVEDARTLKDLAFRRPVAGEMSVIVLGATRFFHEAQNALLKLFEEPPATTCLFLVVPSEGNVIPTLRSRLVPLPTKHSKHGVAEIGQQFLKESSTEREKHIERLLERAKSDDEDIKASARASAVALMEGLVQVAYEKNKKEPSTELKIFLSDCDRFLPMLHERSAPLKLIFEHLLLTFPRSLRA